MRRWAVYPLGDVYQLTNLLTGVVEADTCDLESIHKALVALGLTQRGPRYADEVGAVEVWE